MNVDVEFLKVVLGFREQELCDFDVVEGQLLPAGCIALLAGQDVGQRGRVHPLGRLYPAQLPLLEQNAQP